MILKVVRLKNGYVIHYASGRIHTIKNGEKLPQTVKYFMVKHNITVEKYGNVVNAIVWK